MEVFSAISYDLLNSELGIVPVISVIEGDSNSGNYSIAQLDELGFTRKIESFKNNENIFTSELQDFRYLRTPDLSAKQSTQTGAVCFGIFMISSILFVSVVFVNEYRKQKNNPIKFQEINNFEESNEFEELENKLKMLKDKKDMKVQKQESELKIKLRAFYLEHNPAKLEFLNDIVKQMEENSFGNSKEHLQILNSQLISRKVSLNFFIIEIYFFLNSSQDLLINFPSFILKFSLENFRANLFWISGLNFFQTFLSSNQLKVSLIIKLFCSLNKIPVAISFFEQLVKQFTVSNNPPFANAITGAPEAIASIGAIPKSSIPA